MNNCMMRFSLEQQVIIITGAAGLLGQMHAKAVIEAGGVPIMIDVNRKNLEIATKNLCEEYPEKSVEEFCCSITDKEKLIELRNYLVSKYNRIDGLINNACNNPTMKKNQKGAGRFETLSYLEWLGDEKIGVYGSICCCQIFGEYMSRHDGGVILNIASDLGVIAPNQSLYAVDGLADEEQPKKPVTYSTVKWGLVGLTKYLATYWADKNVRCNALAFGGVYNNQGEPFLTRVKAQIPMGRMAQKDEYMGSIVYMLSEASSYMTGAVVSIDGGRTAW